MSSAVSPPSLKPTRCATPTHSLRYLRDVGTGGNLTTDAQIAGLAVEWGATVCSNDADFGRFPGVKWTNPLAA